MSIIILSCLNVTCTSERSERCAQATGTKRSVVKLERSESGAQRRAQYPICSAAALLAKLAKRNEVPNEIFL